MAKKEAVDATVSGDDQQVGFRALVMKQAIEYNLAGSAEKRPKPSCPFYSARQQEADRLGGRNHSKGDRKII